MLASVALTIGACTATQTGGSPQPSTQAPTPIATPQSSPTAEASEEPPASAAAGGIPLEAAENADVGPYLTGEGGMTLYTFTNDTKDSGASTCNDDCATAWPPLLAEAASGLSVGDGVNGTITIITRDDGGKQVAYNGWPLYYFANDAAPGDTNGHEVGEVWFVAAP
jgi:predicted lipoprotein with Yx(FWY)xxD motif